VVVAVMLACLAVALVVALCSYAPDQVSGASPAGLNLAGPLGAWLAHTTITAWGVAAFLVPIMVAGFAIAVLRRDRIENLSRRLTGAVLLVPVMAALVHLMPMGRFGEMLLGHWDMHRFHGLGGAVGFFLCGPAAPAEKPAFPGGLLTANLDTGGAALVLSLLVVGCVLLLQVGLLSYLRRMWAAVGSYQKPPMRIPERRHTATMQPGMPVPAMPKDRTTTALKELTRKIQAEETPPADAADLVERIRQRRRALEAGAGGLAAGASEPTPTPVAAPVMPAAAVPTPAAQPTIQEPLHSPRPDSTDSDADAAAEAVPAAARIPPSAPAATVPPPRPKPRRKELDESGYHLPPVDLLDVVPLRRDEEHEAEKNGTARAIEEVFSHFGISVKVVAASRGPVITMYEIQLLDQAMRVNKVEGFEKDISLKLGTDGIRIVAPLPNKKTIGIEVPNRSKEAVVMRDLVEQTDASQMVLPLILGRDVVGAPLLGDLAKMPHLLVAGATGTGKSVCMNAMICSVLLFRGPDEVKFIMVDPKMVELAGYEDIPHLLTPPITDMTKAHAALEWACRTMDERYFALRLVGVRDIKAYNELGEPEIRNRLARKGKTLEDIPGLEIRMPYIIVLVDEYADLMMVNKEVEKSLIRLAAKSRAAGLHLILTTQRPSADVVTGLIKSNLPARICFRVADKSNSRVVLDSGGAENLIGKGDMLYLPPGTSTLVRGQGVWVKDKEIEAIIEHAKSQGQPQYDESITAGGAVAMAGGGSSGDGKSSEWIGDHGFHEAVQSMYRYNRTGADFFRRKLNIGYNKATSYVEMLEDLGFVGPQKGTAAREIVKSWDDWIELLKENGVTWDEEDDTYHNPVQLGSGNPGQA
jgi:S-DNA-T family DNA segregation ATPase FtsK/SpoIIIE